MCEVRLRCRAPAWPEARQGSYYAALGSWLSHLPLLLSELVPALVALAALAARRASLAAATNVQIIKEGWDMKLGASVRRFPGALAQGVTPSPDTQVELYDETIYCPSNCCYYRLVSFSVFSTSDELG